MDIPILVISYNNPTYVKSMVEQVKRYTSHFYVVDNASTFEPHLEYLKTIEDHVIRMDKNYGHSVYYQPTIWGLSGDKFIITDPDLTLNPNMPTNAIQILSEISDRFQVNKVGLALDITGNIRKDFRLESGDSIIEWESRFWTKPIPHETYELYEAPLDTTFCLIHKGIPGYSAIRIAGDFTCKHRPWYDGWENELLPGELEAYRNGNVSSHYTKPLTEMKQVDMMEAKYYEPAGKEHYRLLEHLSHQFSNTTIIDIGTYDGLSAFALSTNLTNNVISFDIVVKPGLPSKPNIQYSTDNLMTPEGRNKWKDVLLNAPFMFLDIDPHEGTREYDFYEWLRENDYRGFVICDDIWYFGKMSENFWDKIPSEYKINATYQGHWSGTGVLRLHPGKAEECLASFVDPDFNYGRSVLDMVIRWHPNCEVAQRIRSAFYHMINLELGDGIENYLTDGTPAYSVRLLKTQELLYEAGKSAQHALIDGVPNSHAVFLLLLSNPRLTIDCLCDSVPSSLSYLNSHFDNRISIGRTRSSYDLVHIDRPDIESHLKEWIAPGATILIPHWNRQKKRLYTLITEGIILWVESTPSVLRAKNRYGPRYTPETYPPSESSSSLPM